jgi:SAM-dependent methyltransferase
MRFQIPPILLAIGAQAVVLVILSGLRWLIPLPTPMVLWVFFQALGSAILGRWWSLGPYWLLFQIALPILLALQLGYSAPPWVYPALLAILLLIYGGGIFSRVPLYNSGLPAWNALADLIPENESIRFIDLGAGLGGPLAYIAKRRPRAELLGVEASPLVWLIGWLRTRNHRPRCYFHFGSIWNTYLGDAQIVFAFLSPAPMSALWAKVKREMPPSGIFISHSFEVPGQAPEKRIPLPGKKDAALLVYRIN